VMEVEFVTHDSRSEVFGGKDIIAIKRQFRRYQTRNVAKNLGTDRL